MREWHSVDEIDFSKMVRPGDTVIWTQGPGEPTALLERLLAQRHSIGRFRMFVGAGYCNTVRPEHGDVISFVGLGGVGTNRSLCDAGLMQVIPAHLSSIPAMLEGGALVPDVVLMQLSRNGEGELSFGPTNSYVQAALPRARVVLAEVNDQAPWTHSRSRIDARRIDGFVRTSRPLVQLADKSPDEVELRIARHMAAHVPDAAALQVGIGALPNALFAALAHHRDLGVHSGVIGDGIVGLIERGVVTNAAKRIDTGFSVTGGLLGTDKLYRFVHQNPAFFVEPVSYTHRPGVLVQLDRFVAVNSALEIDLTGQINAEVAGASYVGTVGGQLDFVRAAMSSNGGRSIIGLPSRTRGGKPRIVPRISSGIVTTPRSDADLVVTEFGVAQLRHQPIAERIRRLIEIAHPDDREALARASHGIAGAAVA
jgi:acetyl-CoA hydrolase